MNSGSDVANRAGHREPKEWRQELREHLSRPHTDHRSRLIRVRFTIDWQLGSPFSKFLEKPENLAFALETCFESKLRFAKALKGSPVGSPERRFWLTPLACLGIQIATGDDEEGLPLEIFCQLLPSSNFA